LPTTNAKLPFVSWPSTAETVVQATVYPPSPIGLSPTTRPFGSSDAAVEPRSHLVPCSSRTWISLPFGEGGSLNAMRTSVGGFTSRASAAGFERT